jgi:two-component system response regulator YesN
MLKLIIVDDERATREKLIENMDWDNLRIQVAGEARDGEEGLELAQRLQPDIILMDVRMPRMNGMECAAEIRKSGSECKIIFLSGYTDKEYLKSAIQMKAVDYIEKPIDLDELHTVLEKTVSICEEEQLNRISQEEIHSKIEMSQLWIKQELALEMIGRSPDAPAIKKQLESLRIPVNLNDNYRCIVLKFNLHRINDADGSGIMQKEKVLDAIYCGFESASDPCVAGALDGSHAILHVCGRTSGQVADIRNSLKRIQAAFDSMYQCDGAVTAGIGKQVRGMENLHLSYHNARRALEKSFLTGYDSILLCEDETEPAGLADADEIPVKLRALFRDGDLEQALSFVEELQTSCIRQADRLRIQSVKAVYLSLLLEVSTIARDNGLAAGTEWKDRELQWAELVNQCTIHELTALIREKLTALFGQSREIMGKSKKIRSAMEYIKEHFSEDLSVVRIAEHLEMRSTYLSTLFKKETGQVLSEYIEAIRMEKAKELLQDDRLKMNDVAQSVGYNNANYFTSVFKKATGVYPSEYRRNHVR